MFFFRCLFFQVSKGCLQKLCKTKIIINIHKITIDLNHQKKKNFFLTLHNFLNIPSLTSLNYDVALEECSHTWNSISHMKPDTTHFTHTFTHFRTFYAMCDTHLHIFTHFYVLLRTFTHFYALLHTFTHIYAHSRTFYTMPHTNLRTLTHFYALLRTCVTHFTQCVC